MIEIFDRKGFDCVASVEANSLQGVDLSGQDLSNANLVQMDLRGANLSNCKLVGADLRLANLSGANLSGADLSNAEIMSCQFDEVEAKDIVLGELKLDMQQRAALKDGGADVGKSPLDITIKQA